MSQVAISGNVSGTGTLTIAAPNTNSNRTLTLPDGTGTFNISGVVNEVPAGTVSAPSIYPTGDTNTGIFFPAADTIAFTEGGAESMRIDSSGNLLVGTTSSFSGGNVLGVMAQASGLPPLGLNRTTSTGPIARFYYASSEIGNISTNGSNCTFNSTSDYRLKEDILPMTGALAKVTALKPVVYKWKLTGIQDEGFIAHELAEVCPSAVTGEKDAVDAEGNPKYQGIDTSFLVATLTAAIQEQQAIITQLQTDVAALKGTTP
jgi:hypothetical protein